MNAETFDQPPVQCPVCHHVGRFPSVKMMSGLLTCPQCRSRLVVGLSGHYVRDPFSRRSANTSKKLRQQSRPWARIMRDSGISKHSPLIAMLASLIFVSFTLSVLSRTNLQNLPLQDWLNQVIKLSDLPDDSH